MHMYIHRCFLVMCYVVQTLSTMFFVYKFKAYHAGTYICRYGFIDI
jgi:hypothetical protein